MSSAHADINTRRLGSFHLQTRVWCAEQCPSHNQWNSTFSRLRWWALKRARIYCQSCRSLLERQKKTKKKEYHNKFTANERLTHPERFT